MTTAVETHPSEAIDLALAAQVDEAMRQAQLAPPPVEQAPAAPLTHRPLIRQLLHDRFTRDHDGRRRSHAAARGANDAATADYARIQDFLSEHRDLAIETVKRRPWLALSPALMGVGLALAARRNRREHPESAREFRAAVSRRVGALAVGSAERSSQWLLDQVHNVDWWELAKWATQNDEIKALATASGAAGPYGKAASAAYWALEAAVAYHEAPQRGDSRMPAVFGAIVSHALHSKLKGRTAHTEGKAATEELLRRAAELRAIAAKAS
jgi:hypothetical protein